MSVFDRLLVSSASTPVDAASEAVNGLLRDVWGIVPPPAGGPSAPRQQGDLDNRGATFPGASKPASVPVSSKKMNGASRWRLKSKVVRLLRPADGSKGPGVCGCGYAGTIFKTEEIDSPDGTKVKKRYTDRTLETVRLHRRESGASVSNVMRCDSPWLCPTCGPGRAIARQERILDVIEATEAQGGSVAFVTLTVRHNLSSRLADVKRLVSEASRKARQGNPWKNIVKAGEILGVVQGVEVLHNRRSGWHYHAHLIVPGLGSPKEVEAAARRFVARYLKKVAVLGGEALIEGQDVELVWDDEKVSHYAGKGSAAWEVAGGLKEARAVESRTPWDLVTLAAAGDIEADSLFREYADCMPGTRSCVVSSSLAAKLGLSPCADEDKPIEEEEEGEQRFDELDGLVGELKSSVWRTVVSRGLAWQVLDAVEKSWPWLEVQRLADILSDPDRYDKEGQRRVHAPSAMTIAATAAGLVWSVKGGPPAAIAEAMDREKRWATSHGIDYKPPRMRDVLEQFTAMR